ncbi:ribosomal protection-like ABC-F family protein [Paenibacillus xerothermodurans]|uniref:ABC-F type ribosomal protection protein n=1 Tax=Paenibacillus xerothermodurans TaxID=1977292 RepID=A0A2W1NMF9_PAEXE|nr:ABC-F type ribosomal protection protein [Paenibacillus xerothermodurans]PZE20645.1 ABC-F type ribosomal protection protein [Paenibacillus xerothermodurans]
MTLITCRNLNKSFGEQFVLKNVNLAIGSGERIGLVGVNGAGKSTLANLIYGSMTLDGGTVVRHKRQMKIGYLLQSTSYTVNTFSDILEDGIGLHDEFLTLTSHLGLQKVKDWDVERVEGLSGGERTKLAIAHIWASKPDLLILDEPTNHLDFSAVDWLVQELQSYGGTTLIISHDRYFLDQTVQRIIELDDGTNVDYAGNYTFYREEKERRFRSQLHQYEEQRKYEQKIEAEISRLKNWSDKAHREAGKTGKMADMRGTKEFYRSKAKKMDQQIKSRIKRLERIAIEGVQRPKGEAQVRFELEAGGKRGKRIIEASGVGKTYGERVLFQDSSFYIQRGERIGLLGPNGCGKTTLIRLIIGSDQLSSGTLWVSPTAKLAYLTQDVMDLEPERSVLDLISGSYSFRDDAGKVRTLLANMGIEESLLRKPVKQLSLGERTRVKLADLIMRDKDVLILDEPTNHLDLASREQLEETLLSYDGTLLVVSHDRYFLEKTCDKLLVFEGNRIRRVESGFRAFMEKTASRSSFDMTSNRAAHQAENDQMEERMRVENRMAVVLAELGSHLPGVAQYEVLDREFKELLERKKRLT